MSTTAVFFINVDESNNSTLDEVIKKWLKRRRNMITITFSEDASHSPAVFGNIALCKQKGIIQSHLKLENFKKTFKTAIKPE
jgi:hypothetical protein